MTMTRETKTGHQRTALALAMGRPAHWKASFQSPREIAARGGRRRMTVTEYYAYRMGRQALSGLRLELHIADRAAKHRVALRVTRTALIG